MAEENKNKNESNNESADKQQILLGILKDIKDNVENAINILGGLGDVASLKIEDGGAGEVKIIEGVFAGDKMIGADGKTYDIPPNYASKSKLVEGDILKLTITSSGKFVYKQIGPIARKRIVGELAMDSEKDEFWVVSDTSKWRILKASVTYFKGEPGDKAAFLIPQDGPSKWAAVENIIKAGEE